LGGLNEGLPYSVQCDADWGNLTWYQPGLNATLNVQEHDRTGKIKQKVAVQLEGVPLVHDFAGKQIWCFYSSGVVNCCCAGGLEQP